MSSKKEEKAAFERLKKAFPNKDVSLEAQYQSWRIDPKYYAYIQGLVSTICETLDTADAAVDRAIAIAEARRKEVISEEEKAKEEN